MKVVKRDGRVEEFNVDKVYKAVSSAASRIYLDDYPIRTLTSSVVVALNEYLSKLKLTQVSVDEIHNNVETILMSKDSSVAKEYIIYRQRRTDIRESNGSLMDTIEEISQEMHRDNANTDPSAATKMYQVASAANKKYVLSRLIKPEFAKAHIEGLIHIHDLDYYNLTINCMTHDLSKMLSEGFDNGVGYIRPPKRIGSACALTAIILQSMQNNFFGGQAIGYVDKSLAPYAEAEYHKMYALVDGFSGIDESDIVASKAMSLTEQAVYQAMEALIYNLNTMKARSGNQVPFTSFNFGTDTSEFGRMVSRNLLKAFKVGLGSGESPLFPNLCFRVKRGINMEPDDPNYDIFRLALECAAVRMHPTFAFMDSTFNAPYGDDAGYMGCRTRVIGNVNGPSKLEGKGNLSFTTVNLPHIALMPGNFDENLRNIVDLVIEQLLERYDICKKLRVKDLPFAMSGYYMGSEGLNPDDSIEPAIKNGTLSIGFVGLAEAMIVLHGKHHAEDKDVQHLALDVIGYLRKRMDEATKKYELNFTLIATPAESTAGRFVKLDRQHFGIVPGITEKDYYTNSFHVPVDYHCDIQKKIDIEAPYHELTNAGHISYVELGTPPKDNINGLERIVLYMAEKNMGYCGVNFPIDHCGDCGYLGVIDTECPKCNSVKIKRVRRITGYMSDLSKFNDAKLAELKARVSHGGGSIG